MFSRFFLLLSLFLLISCSSAEKKEKADLHLQIGLSHYESQNYPQALKEFLSAESLDPKNPVVQNNLGLVYFIREKYEQSLKHLNNALKLRSDYTDARNNLARVLIEMGKYKDAEDELSKVLNDLTYTSQDKAFVNLGLAQFHQGLFSKAAKSFTSAIKSNRESCVANAYLGRSYFEEKDYGQAAETLDQAIGYCQKSAFDEPHYFSALSYFRLGQKERSKARFEEILKLYPQGEFRQKARAMLDILNKDGK